MFGFSRSCCLCLALAAMLGSGACGGIVSASNDAAAVAGDSEPTDVKAVADVSVAELAPLDVAPEVADAPADVPADAVKVDAGCTEAGCPCTANPQCDSGFCIETSAGQVCGKLCTTTCDDGFKCGQVTGSGGDIQNICVPAYPRQCEPCNADSDCNNVLGGADSRCVPYKDGSGSLVGAYCATKCAANSDCAPGFSCKETTSLGGIKGNQCVKDDLVCGCDPRATKLQLSTACSNASAAGTCGGKRTCSANGLSACDAPSAQAEQCNLKDDDCDGQTDEPSPGMCVDNLPCTYDNCIAGQCQHPPATGPCDDNSACTSDDLCANGLCVGKPVLCDDKNACTTDSCDANKGCLSVADDKAICSDNNVCSVSDTCSAGGCVPGVAQVCDDKNLCTSDSCDSKLGCIFAPNSLPCSDDSVCTIGDLCLNSACKAGGQVLCNDGNPCTDDSCDAIKGCISSNNALLCSDGNVCTEGDACKDGVCQASSFKNCDDNNVCTNDNCDAKKGCVTAFNTASCSDGNICTEGELCKDGVCGSGLVKVCDDGNVCTTDICDAGKGCVKISNAEVCSDGNACTVGDACIGGKCLIGKLKSCDDSNPCTDDACDADNGCVNTPNVAGCSDGNACSINDVCNGGKCKAMQAIFCDDGNACTDDDCDPKTGCVFKVTIDSCSDGNVCTQFDACVNGVCQAGMAKNCDDGNSCTDDSCTAIGGCVHNNNAASCNDGSVCTGGDVCKLGACTAGIKVPCSDGNVCTDDSCDPILGCIFNNNAAACDDGNGCTNADLCAGGKCTGGSSCNANALCTPAAQSVSCVCNKGFTGNGFACSPVCGDGIVSPGEPCDDKNLNAKDGCSATCTVELGWVCAKEPSVCTAICGDGVVLGAEICDDGNQVNTDACVGCSAAKCGDGFVQAGVEQCDNGANNANVADKCRTNCKNPVCGDGITDAGEQCDDGNLVDADGCSNACKASFTQGCAIKEAENPCYTTIARDVVLCGNTYTSGNIQTACNAGWSVCTLTQWNAKYPKGVAPGGTLASFGTPQAQRMNNVWNAMAPTGPNTWVMSECTSGYNPWNSGKYLYNDAKDTVMKGSGSCCGWDTTFAAGGSSQLAVYCCKN